MTIHQHPALVLNADYQPLSYFPLSTWDFERTMRNVQKGSVVVVETYDKVFRSASGFEYAPPSVVALKRYIAPPKKVPFTRFNLMIRDRFRCQYCGGKFDSSDLNFDHVVPRCDGGETTWTNIVASCYPCNGRKDRRRDVKPLRQPYEPSPAEMAAIKRSMPANHLHETWIDFLYWDTALER